MENITGYVSNPQDVRQKLPSGSRIPQRNYRPKTPLPDTMVPQIILFTMADELWFPAQFALQEMYHCLVGGDDIAFTEKIQTIHLRIEVPGLLSSLSHPSSDFMFTVARVRWMGSTSERCVSKIRGLFKVRSR